MKKILFSFILFSTFLFAENHTGFIAFKPSYFWPQDHLLRSIYKGGLLPLAEVGAYLWRNSFLSVESGYFYKKTMITSFDVTRPTSITQVPLTLFLGFYCPIKNVCDLYLKIGPNGIFTKTNVQIPNLPSIEKKYTFGATIGGGIKGYLFKGAFLEVFCNYLYNKKKLQNSGEHFSVFFGGIQAGLGIGYRF
jgi:hypothetical protein